MINAPRTTPEGRAYRRAKRLDLARAIGRMLWNLLVCALALLGL